MKESTPYKIFLVVMFFVSIGCLVFSINHFKKVVEDKKNSEMSVEQIEEARKRVEKNEAWFEGFKHGQIEAINGRIMFRLEKNQLGEIVWVHK